MFSSEFGTQISWLLPAALILLVALAWLTRRAPRTDRSRAALLLWGGWLLVTVGVFSFMSGIIHPYYTVALAPAIGALVGIGGVLLWRERDTWYARGALALTVLASGWWGYRLLARDPSWHPTLRYLVLALGLIGAAALLIPRRARALTVGTAALSLVAVLAGSAAYALPTAATPHTGSIPAAGPAGSSTGMGGFGGQRGGFGGADAQGGNGFPGGGAGGPGGGGGGEATVSAELAALLKAAGTRWSAATNGDQTAAGLELASGTAVMAIGGWSGSDPAPTLARFQAWVSAGEVHYYLASGAAGGATGGGIGGGGATGAGGSAISSWVETNFTASTVGGHLVYDLTKPAS